MITLSAKNRQLISFTINTVLVLVMVFCTISRAGDPPFTVKPGLFDQSNTINLGLDMAQGMETTTVFRPADTTDHYSNGVVMVAFKGWLYCQWQSSAWNEDAQDTWVAYSRSTDGKDWSPPMTLAASIDDGYCSSGGWWVAGDTLIGYINVWPASVSPRGGYTYYTKSADGLNWSSMEPVFMANGDTLNGIFEQDPHALPDGRIINAAHFQPGINVCPIYTDNPSGIAGWIRADFTNLSTGSISREIEPSWFLRADDSLVMIFRDQNSTFYKLASISGDRGESWTTPVLTDMPDSRAKQSAGNLPNGVAYMVNNPVTNKDRIPLAITLSADGRYFNTAYVLRQGGDDLQEQRYSGTAKHPGYHYPKSMVWQDYLYVSYATNKEDVEYTRVPLNSLIIDTTSTGIELEPSSNIPGKCTLYQNYPNPFNPTTEISYRLAANSKVKLLVYDALGRVVKNLVNEKQIAGMHRVVFDAQELPSGVYFYRIKTAEFEQTRKMLLLR